MPRLRPYGDGGPCDPELSGTLLRRDELKHAAPKETDDHCSRANAEIERGAGGR